MGLVTRERPEKRPQVPPQHPTASGRSLGPGGWSSPQTCLDTGSPQYGLLSWSEWRPLLYLAQRGEAGWDLFLTQISPGLVPWPLPWGLRLTPQRSRQSAAPGATQAAKSPRESFAEASAGPGSARRRLVQAVQATDSAGIRSPVLNSVPEPGVG